jgi:hypothetical protein
VVLVRGVPLCVLVVAFDAETYLRLLGERLLDDPDPQHRHPRSRLAGPAAALVAAGTVAADQAWRVIDDYRTATNIRTGEPRFVHFGPPSRRRRTAGLTPRQIMVIDREIAVGGGQLLLRDLAISADGGTLRYRWRPNAAGGGRGARMFGRPGPFPWGTGAPEIIDSAGNRLAVRSGRGGGDGEGWDPNAGELELRGTLAPEVVWLQIAGIRIDLDRRAARWEARVEPLETQDPVERFLWRQLAVSGLPFAGATDLESSIQALLAEGALNDSSPLLRDVRTVAAAMPGHGGWPQGPSCGSTRGMREPWRSLLRRRGRQDGPEWTLAVGAVSPVCDVVQFAANAITSDTAGFEVEFEVTPNVLGAGALDQLPVAWWARDDRENHYLGWSPNTLSGSDQGARGAMRYWPALDPRATRLELLVCVEAHQAVISVSLDENLEEGP